MQFNIIKNALKETSSKVLWNDIMREFWIIVSSPLTQNTEQILLEILKFDGKLAIDLSQETPHSMSPEDMLKSLAIQGLTKWTGLAYLKEMEYVQKTTTSSSLSSLIRDIIQECGKNDIKDAQVNH